MPPKLIYQDEHFIAVNKPQKLLSVPGLSEPENLFDQVKLQFPNARMVHRLDMATSGLILFALNHPAQKHLNKQFEQKTIRKSYTALVEGTLDHRFGEIALPMGASTTQKTRHCITWNKGRHSQTFYECVSKSHKVSKLKLYPVTGRSHQLRVHCQYIGHPIIGDAFYGNQALSNRLMLHAETLTLKHPISEQALTLTCPCPF